MRKTVLQGGGSLAGHIRKSASLNDLRRISRDNVDFDTPIEALDYDESHYKMSR